jgi:hypothetical protein
MAIFLSLAGIAVFNLKTGRIMSAQTGTISGRVIYEDGSGAPNLTVYLNSINANQQPARARTPGDRTATDEEGVFKFTGVAPGVYSVNVFESKGYVRPSLSPGETQDQRYCRLGDNLTITLVKGGVITGRVTAANGEPMVGVRVYPVMTRDAQGLPIQRQSGGRARMTNDLGIYRLFGLMPGTYVLHTRPESNGPFVTPYEGNVPTYHPSSTRDTAGEITVGSGSEATGIDIRYRGERGRVVSGTVAGVGAPSAGVSNVGVTLTSLSTGNVIGSSGVRPGENANAFAIYGVTDGEYEIIARHLDFNSVEAAASLPRRITVKGADVTGIELRLAPMASISGKITLETAPEACENRRKSTLEEILLQSRRDDRTSGAAASSGVPQLDIAPNEKGDFTFFNLRDGRYFLDPKLPNDSWYVKSISANAPAPAAASARGPARPATPIDASRNGVTLKSGEKLTGLSLIVTDGAASLRGKVVAQVEGARLPSRLRVHLIPAEDAAADSVLRYAETGVRGDLSFVLNNLAPGKYWLVARVAPDDEPVDRPSMPLAWDANERAKLRREAMAVKNEVELQACGRVSDYVLRFKP